MVLIVLVALAATAQARARRRLVRLLKPEGTWRKVEPRGQPPAFVDASFTRYVGATALFRVKFKPSGPIEIYLSDCAEKKWAWNLDTGGSTYLESNPLLVAVVDHACSGAIMQGELTRRKQAE